jgi:hypothetical protein
MSVIYDKLHTMDALACKIKGRSELRKVMGRNALNCDP